MRTPQQAIGVSRLLVLLRQSLGRAFPSLLVSGEVIDPTLSQRGHLYFRLREGNSEIKAVMWRREAQRLRGQLPAGTQVIVRGSLDLYAPRGDLQLKVDALMRSGTGQKLQQLEMLKQKLRQEGLFDRERRELPRFPKKIGLVTSLGSAVLHDIYQTVQKRYPSCSIILSPSHVSGEQAGPDLVKALHLLRGRTCLAIVARGGGAFEELLPFSNEALVRAAAEFPAPLISAVGHGSDQVLLDLVADHTAATPTAAAVLATPDGDELKSGLSRLENRLQNSIRTCLHQKEDSLKRHHRRCLATHPQQSLSRSASRLEGLSERLRNCLLQRLRFESRHFETLTARWNQDFLLETLQTQLGKLRTARGGLTVALGNELESRRLRLESVGERLKSAGPGRTLERGFCFVSGSDGLVTGVGGRSPGEELELHFADGRMVVEIKRIDS